MFWMFQKLCNQTGWYFLTRFNEDIHSFGNCNKVSKYLQHILQTWRSLGAIDNIMEVAHITKEARYMNNIDKFYICEET
jgi:hypothetical protein